MQRVVLSVIVLLGSLLALLSCGSVPTSVVEPTFGPTAAPASPTSAPTPTATRIVAPPTTLPSQTSTETPALPSPSPTAEASLAPSPTATSVPQAAPTATATTLPLPTETPPPADESGPSQPQALVLADLLNVRAGPGTTYRRIGQLREGTAVDVMGRNEEETWWQIAYPPGEGGSAWVSAEYVEVSPQTSQGPFAALPSGPPTPTPDPAFPLIIDLMRQRSYPGSDITIETQLDPGSNYDRYIASYRSDGLKIYALLTVPRGERPEGGWPVVLFNHGYIPPDQYRTTERYVAYVDAFARNGYIVFRSDYRGHGSSEGDASSAYGSPDYTVDVLNAVASIKRYPQADPNRIGMWGHSMGGGITLRAMVVTGDIKAGVIWAGTVAPYSDLIERWGRRAPSTGSRRSWALQLLAHGTVEENPAFWASIDPNSYLSDLSGPIQLHHGTADASVPVEYSTDLYERLQAAGQPSELFIYQGDNHNLSGNLSQALARSVEFFDVHLS